MDALSAIATRSSAVRLGLSAPSRQDLNIILHAGLRAPDPGRLSSWRFAVVEGDSRVAFGQAMAPNTMS